MAVAGTTSTEEAFERALEAILARVFSSDDGATRTIAVAYSGGLDSTVLLHLVRDYAIQHDIALHAFHVHHGLSPNADQWLAHCAQQCTVLGVAFDARRVELRSSARGGIEQAARGARYAALGDLCREHAVGLVLTAHHLDDQAETVLLQLLRGSGVAGLSGMDMANRAPALLDDPNLWMGRPLLELSRTELEQFASKRGLSWVDDESNEDIRYARNNLRHSLMPVLAQRFPGYQHRLSRTAQHAQSAQRLLDEVAAEDLLRCSVGDGLDLQRLKELSVERGDNVLRYWFASHGVRMPSTAWLTQLRTQILTAGADAQVCVTHADCEVWRYRGCLMLATRVQDAQLQAEPVQFQWNGEAVRAFPLYRGRLMFENAPQGIDIEWLKQQQLVLRYRRGGERIRLGANRPTRDLKRHFQALGIPPLARRRLPMVESNSRLLFVAGIGLNWGEAPQSAEQGVLLRWIADPG